MKARELILKFFLCLILFSCSNEEVAENLKTDLETKAIKLESPEGFKIATSLSDLKGRIRDNKGLDLKSIEVESVEFIDSEKVSVALVNYKNKKTGILSYIAIAKGEFTYDTEHLQINEAKNSIAKVQAGGCVEISCGGCANCGVQGHRDGETGDYHFSCESDCCTMKITEMPDGC